MMSVVNKYGIVPFIGGNADFGKWLFRVKVALEENECSEAIEVQDQGGEKPIKDKQKFTKKDVKAKSIIIQSLADNVLEVVSECETAHQMVSILSQRFLRTSLSESILLKKKLANLKYKPESQEMSVHLEEFDSLVRQLARNDIKPTEKELVCNLLLSLPKSYDNLVTSIETLVSKEDITLDFVKSRLLNEELKLKNFKDVQSHSHHPQSFAAFQIKCYKCGKKGHKRSDCKSGKEIKCFKCGKSGHKSNVCKFQSHANNSASNFVSPDPVNEDSSSGFQMNDGICLLTAGDVNVPTEFIIDSGCTDHICNNIDYFYNYVTLKEPINIAVAKSNEYMQAVGIGNIHCFVFVNNNFVKCKLQNVLYVPELKQNLLSVKRLEKLGHKLIFESGKVNIYLHGKLIAEGFRDTLYKLKLYFDNSECYANHTEENIKLWHARLGHLGEANLKKLVKKNLANGINTNILNETLDLCQSCIEGKQCRLPFGTRTRSTRPLEIIHSDVCGPISPISYDGSKYFVTFMDEFTHFVMVYCIKSKNEVLSKFKEYVKLVHNKFNVKVHKLRCDNGGEFSSHEFKSFCSNEGIILDYTTAYTPELNGKSERLNRTLVERMRTMISESGVPKYFWSEILYTATYLLNRSPTNYLRDKTPAEMWYNVKPNLSNLRVFGCTAYAHVPDELRSKLDFKSEKCVLLGYSFTGYRLWNISKEKIVVSRNVIFNENELYFKSLNKSVDCKENKETLEEEETVNTETENIESTERVRKVPKHFQDYELYLVYNAFSFLDNVPTSYNDAMLRENKLDWEKAIEREFLSISENKTWEIVDIGTVSNKKSILDSKWVFTYKDHESEEVNQYKARLVIRGFAQSQDSYNYDELYSPVAKMSTIRTLLSVGNCKMYKFEQYDVKTAFLNGKLNEDVFMYPPKGLNVEKGKVLKLNKSLYGLKQAAKCWNNEFNNFMVKIGFVMSENDTCLYSKQHNGKFVYLLLYVDDIIVASDDQNLLDFVRNQLKNTFKIKDKGILKYFLGIEIDYDLEKGYLKLSQQRYTEKLLSKFNMTECTPRNIPLDPNYNFVPSVNNNQTCDKPYKELLGSLMYLMLGTRPDLSYSVNYFSRYQNCFTDELWFQLKGILRYLRGTVNYGLIYTRQNHCELNCFVDSDWAGDKVDRKSVSGYLYKLNHDILSWSTRKQVCVSLSSTESEIVALCSSIQEGLWLGKIINDLHVNLNVFNVFEDNQGCINIIKNPGNNKRVKHIDIKYRFICDKVTSKELNLMYIDSKNQTADILTKALSKDSFIKLRNLLSVQELR